MMLLTVLGLRRREARGGRTGFKGVVAHAVARQRTGHGVDRGPVKLTGEDRVVIATNLPFLDRGGHFARAEPQTVLRPGLPDTTAKPSTGCTSAPSCPSRSLRDVPDADGSLLLVGGNGHVTGRATSPVGPAGRPRGPLDPGLFPEAPAGRCTSGPLGKDHPDVVPMCLGLGRPYPVRRRYWSREGTGSGA